MNDPTMNALYQRMGEISGSLEGVRGNLSRIGDEFSTLRADNAVVRTLYVEINTKLTGLTTRMDAIEKPAKELEMARSHWLGIFTAIGAAALGVLSLFAGHAREFLGLTH